MVAAAWVGMVVQTAQGAMSHVASLYHRQPAVRLLYLEGKIVEVIIWWFCKKTVLLCSI